MRAIFGLVLVVGMGLAGFAVFMVKGHFAEQEAKIRQQAANAQAIIPTTDVYAVNRSIAYGELLTLEDVQTIKHTQEFLPEGAFATQEELFPQGVDVPRVVLRAMEPNEPVTTVKVTAPGEIASITTRLTEGMRAFTINVDSSSGVSGVRPGDRVDVLWTGNLPGQQDTRSEVTRLIETGLEVIAVDQSSDVNRAEGEVARLVCLCWAVAKLALRRSNRPTLIQSRVQNAPWPRPRQRHRLKLKSATALNARVLRRSRFQRLAQIKQRLDKIQIDKERASSR